MKALNKVLFGLLATTCLANVSYGEPIISNATPIPDANVLLNFNGSGLDWVYAGPIAPGEFAPFNLAPVSYRAAEGWRAATAAEWAARPNWNDFIVAGNPCNIVSPLNGYTNQSCYLLATPYWSDTFSHVDMNDFAQGRVTDGVNNFVQFGVYETIFVRGLQNPVPEPGTFALLGLGLAGLGLSRRRKAN